MKIGYLKRLAKLKYLREMTIEGLICSFGLYEQALIDLADIQFAEGTMPMTKVVVQVSEDLAMLNRFLTDESRIMLPCPECLTEQPFAPEEWENPRVHLTQKEQDDSPAGIKIKSVRTSSRGNVFNQAEPYYFIGKDVLSSLFDKDAEKLNNQSELEQFGRKCVQTCKINLLSAASEIRRDYTCGLNADHRAFVNFRVYDPFDQIDPIELKNAKASGDEELKQAIDKLEGCLVIQKVGQYPSLADLQLFDVAKYRSILKENFKDYTRAIGLYADGIGCGAFVYLRRILESLAEESHIACHNSEGWDEKNFKDAKFVEKLDILEQFGNGIIPANLEPYKKTIYGVLSKGVHESSENECLEMFPYMKYAIEEILDERLAKREREKKLADFQKRLLQQSNC